MTEVMETLERRARRSWHHIRRRLGGPTDRPLRLVVEKATWLDDARSPVMLMIDDLTNAWHDPAAGSRWAPGGDWGGGHDAPDSALSFLENRLLKDFPEARVTFFTVAGPISQYTHAQPFSRAAALDADQASCRFFAGLAADPRFELAYHGHNHGSPGPTTEAFVQEWRGFPTHEAAVAQTKRGLDTFVRAIGTSPTGGKYGGWDYNHLAEGAVDECGFLWWCRDWMPRDVSGRIQDGYYEPQFFGRNLIVALPATVHGHFWDRRQIDLLLARRQLITIEEHIAPIRPDGLVQTPNIVDDMDDLRRLYSYLSGKQVWHATGTEIATYVTGRERSLIYDTDRDGFSIRYDGRISRPMLTLRIDASAICSPNEPLIDIVSPNGVAIEPTAFRYDPVYYRHLVTVPVETGRYAVRAGAQDGSSTKRFEEGR